MDRNEIKDLIKEILVEIEPLEEIEDETLLIGEVLDSLSVIYLFSEICERLDVEIPIQEATIDNFSTVETLANLVEKYIA